MNERKERKVDGRKAEKRKERRVRKDRRTEG